MSTDYHPELSRARLARGELYYAAAGAGTPVLLIHGSLCDCRYWRWQLGALPEYGLRVLAPSLRACWPELGVHPQAAYAIEAQAEDLAQLLAAQAQPAHIVGHSRGAQVAVALARTAPELCSSLTLADPGFRFADEPEQEPFYTDAVALLQAGDAEAAVESFIDHVNGAGTWARMVSWFKTMVRDNAATLLSQIAQANQPVSSGQLRELRCPVLLMNGALSSARYQDRVARLAQLLPHAAQARIALAAHGMNLANPRAFNKALAGFINSASE